MTPEPATRRINRGRGHSYVLDGEKAVGVTSILSEGLPKPALVGWAAGSVGEFVADRLELDETTGHVYADKVVADLRRIGVERDRIIPPDGLPRTKISDGFKGLPYYDRDKAANRGTEIHRIAQHLAEGEEVEVPEELTGHIDAYLRFREEWAPFEELVEFTVVNRANKYMGTGDIICRLGAAESFGRCLIDIKTNRSGPFGETALQLAAYRNGETIVDDDGTESDMPEIDWCGVLWLRADGYDLYPFDTDPDVFRTFLYVQQVARFQTDRSQTVKGAALTPRRIVSKAGAA